MNDQTQIAYELILFSVMNSSCFKLWLSWITSSAPIIELCKKKKNNNKIRCHQSHSFLTCVWRSSRESAPVTFSEISGGPFFSVLCGGVRKGRWALLQRCTLIDTLLGVWRRSVTASKWLNPVMSWPFTCKQKRVCHSLANKTNIFFYILDQY